MTQFMADAESEAPLEVVIFNIGANLNAPRLETTSRVFRKVWEKACYSGSLSGREAARHMLRRGEGSIFLRERRRACAGASATRRSPVPSLDFAPWPSQLPANSARKVCTLPISSSILARTLRGCENAFESGLAKKRLPISNRIN